MNVLPIGKQILIASMLCEGSSIRGIERVTGVHRDTIMRLGIRLGERSKEFMDNRLVNLKCKYIQVDEVFTIVKKRKKHLTQEERRKREVGDKWIFIALDSDSKLIVHYDVCDRTKENAINFLEEVNNRISSNFQLSTDSLPAYADAVEIIVGGGWNKLRSNP